METFKTVLGDEQCAPHSPRWSVYGSDLHQLRTRFRIDASLKAHEELLGPRLRLVWHEPDDEFLRFTVDLRHHGYLRVLLLHVVLCDANLVDPYPFSWMTR
jgi:hypothetical protein